MKKTAAQELRAKRRRRVRAKVLGTSIRPRLAVFKSLTDITAQVINDAEATTLVCASLKDIKGGKNTIAGAKEVGKLIAKRCSEKSITIVVFDRGGYQYHGKVKALAEGAREGGLQI